MKVAILSNWHAACGNADYARDLQRELEKEFEVIPCESLLQAQGCQVMLVNWHPARVQMTPDGIHHLHSMGVKVIMILQNSFSGYYDANVNDPLHYANAVVAHQPMHSNIKFTFIPVGIHLVDGLREPDPSYLRCGIAGFPFWWKRFDVTASAAQQAGGSSLLIAPHHEMGDTLNPIRQIQGQYATAEVVRDLLPVEEVVRRLSACTLNIFWYQTIPPDDQLGQSGSVRMGVAAGRPMIISDHPKLKTIAAYEDEFYLAMTEDEVHALTKEIWAKIQRGEPVKRPKRILEEVSWDKTGLQYRNLVKEVYG